MILTPRFPPSSKNARAKTGARLLLAFWLVTTAAHPPLTAAENPEQPTGWSEKDWREMTGSQLLQPFEPAEGYLFAGNRFPDLRWSQLWLASQVWGQQLPEPIVSWFDAQGQQVEQPADFGRHAAVIEARLPDGRVLRRGLTLFRINLDVVNGSDRFPFEPDETPAFGLSPELWRSESDTLTEFVRQATFERLLKTPDGALLIAGLADATRELEETGPATPPLPRARPYERHRQHILTIREHLDQEAQPARDTLDRPRPTQDPAPSLGMVEQEPALSGFEDEVIPALENLCEEWRDATELPFTLVVARNGHLLFHRAYGEWRDEPVSQESNYPLFSLSKSVAGIMTGLMIDADLLRLDEPLARILPGLDKPPHDPDMPPVTVRRCLMHVTGLTGHSDWGGLQNPWLDEVIGDAFALGHIKPAHQYSGTAYDLVGLAMEHRTGLTVEALFQQHLFGPLGMQNTRIENLGSGIHLRAIDLARLGQLLLNHGRYGDHEFFSPATFQELLPQSYGELFPEIGGDDRADYGLGLYWRTEKGEGRHADTILPSARTLGHGSFSGSVFQVDLEHQMVVAMGRHQSGPDHGVFVRRLLELLLDHMTRAEIPAGD